MGSANFESEILSWDRLDRFGAPVRPVFPCFAQCIADLGVGASTRRRAAGASHRLSGAATSQAKPCFAFPLRPSRACAKQASGAEPPLDAAPRAGRSAAVRRARAIPKPIHLTPHLHSPTTGPISLSIGRNRSRRHQPPKPYHRSSAPLAADPSPPFPDSNQGRSELRRALLHLPSHFPFRFGCCHRREHGSPPCAAACRRPLVAPRPGPSSCATSARMEAAQPCWTYSRPPLPPF